jgi:hypothetical protein
MTADEIIIMMLEKPLNTSMVELAEDYLIGNGWRRDGLTGETWIKEEAKNA